MFIENSGFRIQDSEFRKQNSKAYRIQVSVLGQKSSDKGRECDLQFLYSDSWFQISLKKIQKHNGNHGPALFKD